jgi:ABC-type transporter Mla maintaining outer membrane lipid asymmetry ATPase subunit MlaF
LIRRAGALNSENETLRWPTNLDRAGIEARLAQVREAARKAALDHVVRLFQDPASLSAAQIGANVVAALTWLQDKTASEDVARSVTMQLEMVAMNLKNLK